MKRAILSVSSAGIWITFSEFIRNELLFKNYWIDHFNSIGLTFKTLPLNGLLWVVWSFTFAYILYKLLQKFSFKETIYIVWLSVFFMMWITIYNLQTLPLKLLLFALPLSILEIFIACLIMKKISKSESML